MKLLSLIIDGEYKGLKNQTFDFRRCSGNLHAFVGLNGSGKSQLLELIAEVFSYLERYQRLDFRVRAKFPLSVVLEYQIHAYLDVEDVQVFQVFIQGDGSVDCKTLVDDEWCSVGGEQLELPQHIIGYSSGLNENLQRSFLKNSAQFYGVMSVRALRRKKLAADLDEVAVADVNRSFLRRYPGVFEAPTGHALIEDGFLSLRERDTKIPSTIFLDYDCNALLVASLALLPENEFESLFPEIDCRFINKVVLRYDLRNTAAEEDAIRDIQELVRLLGEDAIVGIGRRTTNEQYDIYELDYLCADITIDLSVAGVRERLSERYYRQPVRLFERLYKIQLLGVKAWRQEDKKALKRDDFFGNVKKPLKTKLPLSVLTLELCNQQGHVVNFDDLSDGEAQLVHVLGACRVFRDDNTLFVFDEPETHLNPSWRTHFHQHLSNSVSSGQAENSRVQVFMSTHSPFLVSSLQKENVFNFERSPDGAISMLPVPSQTYGASFDVLIKRFFGLNSLISQTAVDEIKEKLASGDNQEAKLWIENNVGESMERAYLLRRLEE